MNKGFATIGVIVAIMMVAIIVFMTLYNPVINSSNYVRGFENTTLNHTKEIAGKERLFSKLNENISFQGLLSYPDLDLEYKIKTEEEKYENISLNFNSKGSFYINNKTDIDITIDAIPWEYGDCSYDVILELNGKDILGQKTKNLQESTEITIDNSFLYNIDKDSVNYGKYILSVNADQCEIYSNVNFDRLIKRKLSIDKINETIVIENEVSNDTSTLDIYFE